MWQPWVDLLSDQDKAVIKGAGYEQNGSALWESRAPGKRLALLIVDMQEMLVGPNLPILEAIQHHRTAMGAAAWKALGYIMPFVEGVRVFGLPVLYTRVVPRGYSPEDAAVQIVPSLTPQPEDLVIDKPHTSAFFGTDLVSRLVRRQVDTLIIVGNSTSGCVRAAVVDARQYGFQVIVPVECVFDRIEASHRLSLLDMWMKYAVVLPVAEVLDYVRAAKGWSHEY